MKIFFHKILIKIFFCCRRQFLTKNSRSTFQKGGGGRPPPSHHPWARPWPPAYDGNEKADSLAKKGSDNLDSAQVQLPIPKVLWKGALRSISHRKMRERWRTLPNTHFKRVWRQKFARSIPKLGKESTRTATQFLTGHCELNYHINKYKPTTVPKTCPHCLMEEETMNHFIGQCPKWSYQRGGYFDSFYLSVTDIVDKFSLPRIIGFIQATKRFTKCGEDKA